MSERVIEYPWMLKVIGDNDFKKLMDMGTGRGRLVFAVRDLLEKDMVGMNLSENEYAIRADILMDDPYKPESFDCITCLSTLEHIGVQDYRYCGVGMDSDGDKVAMKKMSGWLIPGGSLLLTVPYGNGIQGADYRTYTRETLAEIIDGWILKQELYYLRVSENFWKEVSKEVLEDTPNNSDTQIGTALLWLQKPNHDRYNSV